ncbi:MAG: hypothetical protein ABFD49_06555 [Armatimonadota bacterium]|nr:hypothetical protein [bacterium]
MKCLSDDLVQYLRSNRLGQKQKILIRELVSECSSGQISGVEYADRYVKRSLKILASLESPLNIA